MAPRRVLRVALAAIVGGLLAVAVVTCARATFGRFENPERDRLHVEACIHALANAEAGITQASLDDCIHDRQWQGRRSCPRHARGYHQQATGGGR